MPNYILTPVVAGVVIKKSDKYFLVCERQKKAYGLWNWPAGHVEKNQTIEQVAVREAREESGFKVKLTKKIGIFQDSTKTPAKHAFKAKIIGGKILNYPTIEILDGRWFTYKEIKKMKNKLRGEWVMACVEMVEK